MALHIILPFPASLGEVALSCMMLFCISSLCLKSQQYSVFFYLRATTWLLPLRSCSEKAGSPCALMAMVCQASISSTRQSPWCSGLVSQEDIFSLIPALGRRWNTFCFSQSYSKSSDLTSAKGSQSQIWHFPDAGEIGCSVADLPLMRHLPTLLKAGVQTVGAGRKRQVAVVENKTKRVFSSASKAQKAKWAIHIISIFLRRSG